MHIILRGAAMLYFETNCMVILKNYAHGYSNVPTIINQVLDSHVVWKIIKINSFLRVAEANHMPPTTHIRENIVTKVFNTLSFTCSKIMGIYNS